MVTAPVTSKLDDPFENDKDVQDSGQASGEKSWLSRFNPLNACSEEIYYLGRFLAYVKPYWFRTTIALGLSIPIGLMDGGIAYLLKPFVEGLGMEDAPAYAPYIPLIIVGLTGLQGGMHYLSTYMNNWVSLHIMQDLRRQLLANLQALDGRFFDTFGRGRIQQVYFKSPESVQANLLVTVKQILTRFSSALCLSAVLIVISWKLSLIAIGALLLMLYPATLIRKLIKKIFEESEGAGAALIDFYNDTVGGIQLIHGYNLYDRRRRQLDEYQSFLLDRTIRKARAIAWLKPVMYMVAALGIALVIWQGTAMVVSGELTVGAFVAFMAAMIMLYNPIKNMGDLLIQINFALRALRRIFKHGMDRKPRVQDKPDAIAMPTPQDSIEFRNVKFTYKVRKRNLETGELLRIRLPVFEGFNLRFQAGRKTAIVGPSGSGKSTILKLILRMYNIPEGQILVDGVDLQAFKLASVRDKIALVTQENFTFHGTIYDNLIIGKQDATEAELWDALEKAHLADMVRNLPEGLHTFIGERGAQLSGGQCQRLSIARAFLKNAPVLILDEATSALDSETEQVVYQSLEALMENRTVMIIAHRLSTVQKADRILVMDEGKVVEEGTHQELLNQEGLYAHLCAIQFQKPGEATVRSLKVSVNP